jgi:hypothetical protein
MKHFWFIGSALFLTIAFVHLCIYKDQSAGYSIGLAAIWYCLYLNERISELERRLK